MWSGQISQGSLAHWLADVLRQQRRAEGSRDRKPSGGECCASVERPAGGSMGEQYASQSGEISQDWDAHWPADVLRQRCAEGPRDRKPSGEECCTPVVGPAGGSMGEQHVPRCAQALQRCDGVRSADVFRGRQDFGSEQWMDFRLGVSPRWRDC